MKKHRQKCLLRKPVSKLSRNPSIPPIEAKPELNRSELEAERTPNTEDKEEEAEEEAEQRGQCIHCERKFNLDRLEKHQSVCKGPNKKLELNRSLPVIKTEKLKWKGKHKNTLVGIRNDRQKHIEIEELIKNPIKDYVTCPHCFNKFKPDLAESHISTCKMTCYKPKATRATLVSSSSKPVIRKQLVAIQKPIFRLNNH